jgi:hypothetical protein
MPDANDIECVVAMLSERSLIDLVLDPTPISVHTLASSNSLPLVENHNLPSKRMLEVFGDWLASEESISIRPSKSWLALNAEWFPTLTSRFEQEGYHLLFAVSSQAQRLLTALRKRGFNAGRFMQAVESYGINDPDGAFSAYRYIWAALERTAENPGRALLIVG